MSNFSNWIKTSHTVKFIAVGFLILILLIPTLMIQNLRFGTRLELKHGPLWF